MSNLSTFLTGNLVIGTTAGTAKEGNWVPAVSDVTGLSGALAGKVDVSGAKVLSDENYSASEKAKLAGILAGAQVASVAGKTGTVTLVSTDVGGLGALATKSTVAVGDMTASGIPSGTTYLRGDGTWATLASGLGEIPLADIEQGGAVEGDSIIWNGTAWVAGLPNSILRSSVSYVATAAQTTFAATYEVGKVDVFLNGVKLYDTDFTATNGTSVVLSEAAAADDVVNLVLWNYSSGGGGGGGNEFALAGLGGF